MGAEICTNFWCFVHNFGYRYARKSFKGSKDEDYGLVSDKILSHNNGPMGWSPGPGKVAKNTPTCGVRVIGLRVIGLLWRSSYRTGEL